MERGQLGIEQRPTTVFVFEGLIAHLFRPAAERVAIRLHQWQTAFDLWGPDYDVLNYMEALAKQVPIEVITWRPKGFADVLDDWFGTIGLPVREVKYGTYGYFSPRYATDSEITTVYDPDPMHRMGYGFKCREFSLGNR